MSYQVLARKYRPATFDTVAGQEHVSRTLKNSIRRQKIAHAYLFCGPRGVGKTSLARIFAKALNCLNPVDAEPCNSCANCKQIDTGASFAVREIDGASHNSVDNVRDLIESFRTLPPPDYRYKVYIIDEVHMLSTAAFNALLKSLEEPPERTLFILATTEPHKIIQTVLSRCQRFDLKSLPQEQVMTSLSEILVKEQIKVEQAALRLIARLSDGSMRDAQSMLERVLAYSNQDKSEITLEATSAAIGIVAKTTLNKLSAAILDHHPAETINLLDSIFSVGHDPVLFLNEFVTHWRELHLVANLAEKDLADLGISGELFVDLKRQTESVAKEDLQDLVELANQGANQALRSNYLRYSVEALLIRMSNRQPVSSLAELFSGLNSGGATLAQEKVAASGSAPQTGSIPGSSAGLSVGSSAGTVPKINRPKRPSAGKPAAPATLNTKPEAKASSPQTAPEQSSVKSESSSQAQPVSADLAVPTPAAATAALKTAVLSWQDFVAFVKEQKFYMLAEYLKRFSPIIFNQSELRLAGPKEAITLLKDAEQQKKLQQSLAKFSDDSRIVISFEAASNDHVLPGRALSGSLAQTEADNSSSAKKAKLDDIMQHPSVKALKEPFSL